MAETTQEEREYWRDIHSYARHALAADISAADISVEEVHRLLNDAARLAQIERQVRELADEIGNAAKYEAYHNREGNAFMLQYWGGRVRAIINPPED